MSAYSHGARSAWIFPAPAVSPVIAAANRISRTARWCRRIKSHAVVFAAALAAMSSDAHAADALDGAAMSWPFAMPFAGLLLSIALGPLLFADVWHRHYGKIAAGWALLTLALLIAFAGAPAMFAAFVHAMLAEYMSFILLLFALYTVAGGILITGDMRGTPRTNTFILAFGTAIASIVGTTGAAMILIRPLIRANAERRYNTHVVIFFIFLVANVGGALSPLGDPPLFIGFLRGVDFFWTTRNLWMQTAIVCVLLLLIFVALDLWYSRSDAPGTSGKSQQPIRVRGLVNIPLIGVIIGSILISASWKSGIAFDVLGTKVALENLFRDAVLAASAFLSLWLTRDEHRAANGFTWEPMKEVAKLFACIFTAIVPVQAMLTAGESGAFSGLLSAVARANGSPNEVAYFWFTGVMSALLDNAPTYLLFFQLAGGDAGRLMTEFSGTLAAISMGSVYMGALTYVGNAPNFMVYAIATERGVKMPSFFGYAAWAIAVMVPVLLLLTFLPLAPLLSPH